MTTTRSTSNPWGVALKSTGQSNPVTRSPTPASSTLEISKRLESLRHVEVPVSPKVSPKRSTSRKYKLKRTPFTLVKEPVFGVLLRSTQTATASTANSNDENYLDLNLKKDQQDDTQDDTQHDITTAPFGVRLKPVRRRYDKDEATTRTYQIDLHPPAPGEGTLLGKYHSQSKSFLELKLKPVKRSLSTTKDDDLNNNKEEKKPEFLELQLRHVIAPEDGGPSRAVTQASFQIPLLHHIDVEELIKQNQLRAQQNAKDPLQELLQLTLENLTPTITQGGTIPESETIHIHLRHIDPHTKASTELGQSIQVTLRKVSYNNRPKQPLPPSMQVALKHVSPIHRERHDQTPDFAKIHLKKAVHVVHEQEEEDGTDHEESFSSNMSLHDGLGVEQASRESKLQNSLPTMDLEQTIEAPEESETTEHTVEEEEENSESVEKEETTEEMKPVVADTTTHQQRTARPMRRTPQRTRSSSLTDVDRMKQRRDHYITLHANDDANAARAELSNQQRRDLLMWYNRMKTPNKKDMKRRVALLPASCDITPEDVELLPWRCKGRFLDINVMNRYFMEDWQGKDEANKEKQQQGQSSQPQEIGTNNGSACGSASGRD